MYHAGVKTVTITMPEELDERAAAEARRVGCSKSELIRNGLAKVLPASPAAGQNTWRELAGGGPEGVSISPDEIDEIVYGF